MFQAKCLVCGKLYTRKRKDQKYCSSKCRRKNENLIEIIKRKKARKKLSSRKCPNCSKIFIPLLHDITKFCSEKCRAQYYNREYRKKNREKVLAYKRKYSKTEKYLEWKREYDREYKDKIRFGGLRRKVMERDKFICQECGAQYPYVRLVVHHIDEDKKNNIMANLQVLCRACHTRLHLGSTDIQ